MGMEMMRLMVSNPVSRCNEVCLRPSDRDRPHVNSCKHAVDIRLIRICQVGSDRLAKLSSGKQGTETSKAGAARRMMVRVSLGPC